MMRLAVAGMLLLSLTIAHGLRTTSKESRPVRRVNDTESNSGRSPANSGKSLLRDSCQIRVLDQDGAPIAGAVVSVEGGLSLRSSVDGVVQLARGAFEAEISASGHESKRVTIATGEEPPWPVVRLRRFGLLRIEVVDEHGAAVPQVEIGVVPPIKHLRPGPTWRSTRQAVLRHIPTKLYEDCLDRARENAQVGSNEVSIEDLADSYFAKETDFVLESTVRWRLPQNVEEIGEAVPWALTTNDRGEVLFELPAADGYRFGVLSSAQCSILPAFDGEVVSHSEGTITVRPAISQVSNLSGELDLQPGREVIGRVVVCLRTSIRASIASLPLNVDRISVSLRRVEHLDFNDDGKIDFVRKEEEGATRMHGDGSIVFTQVKGAEQKELRFVVESTNNNRKQFYFGFHSFYCEDGIQNDVGRVSLSPGRSVDVTVSHQDANGGIVPVLDLPESLRPKSVLLIVRDGSRTDPRIDSLIEVPVDTPFRLHGVEGSQLSLAVNFLPEWGGGPDGFVFSKPVEIENDESGATEYELPVLVCRSSRVSLRFEFPKGRPVPLELYLRREGSENCRYEQIRPGSYPEGTPVVFQCEVEHGRYTLFAHSNSPHGSGMSLYSKEAFEVSGPHDQIVELQSGNAVHVDVRETADFREGKLKQVFLTPVSWDGTRKPHWTFSSPVDCTGVARFVGVPPESLVVTSIDPGARIFSGEAGDTVYRTVRR